MIEGVTVRQAGPDDAVAGVQPKWVALPESVEEIAAVMRACAERDLAVVPVGGGTKLHWGRRPDRCDVLLDLCCLNEVVEHAAGDLVVRVQAGATMEALAATLAAKGQELALDVPLEGATVGGTLATATAGPRSFRYGTPRDLLIGVTVVLADGTVARSGGKVVKNVAGYDLGKLFTGSYGTLGVIAEATFRLHPLPADRRWVSTSLPAAVIGDSSSELPLSPVPLLRALAASQAEPSAITLDWPDMQAPFTVCALVEGAAAAERAEELRAVLAEEGGRLGGGEWPTKPVAGAEAPDGWARLPGDELLIEIRTLATWADMVMTAVRDAAHVTELPAKARMWLADHLVTHVALPGDAGPAAVAAFVSSLRAAVDSGEPRATVRILAAPEEAARRVDRWGPVGGLSLMRRVKEQFDPGRRMSPGRFVGGI
ncbi:FAD-binding oxidoreductase [Thermoactinospora rubra]|uniref:FAD-binding oxidoreductase n=1 Tax=Thermoactinospora rubra TaxID=1088767 RepID=UPI000A0F7B65|nr:FAD-binding oxidoreductase [Thermoactinospora rubra]